MLGAGWGQLYIQVLQEGRSRPCVFYTFLTIAIDGHLPSSGSQKGTRPIERETREGGCFLVVFHLKNWEFIFDSSINH